MAALDFDPTTISGCTGWWAADDMSGFVDGDAVGAGGADGWTNLGSAGGVLTQATANLRPTYQANEVNTTLPAVRFVNSPAGEQDRLISSGFANIGSLITVSAYTIYIVIRPTIGGGTDGSARYYRRPRIFGTNGNDNFHIGLYDTKFALNHNSVTGPKILTPNSFTVNTWNIVQVYYNGSTMSIKFNNGAEGTIAGANIPSLVTTAIIGHGTDLSLDADIAEIITYNVDIGSTDRGVVMTGLGTKYGITV
ncbi:MAG TPA: hypothetical protein VHO25_17820 [Polyangiaceae bacterium]|nr:hypothetical protein [Polyangiaceae bacterium]